MFYSLEGILSQKTEKFVALENQGFGFRIFVSRETLEKLPKIGEKAKFFLHLHVREGAMELYGFLTREEMEFFELLISVSGIGPKSALGLLGLSTVANIKSAIIANKAEFLNRAPGIGRKTAERIILELKSKLTAGDDGVSRLEGDLELEDALVDLGYDRSTSRQAIKKVAAAPTSFGERLKEALKMLGKK
ncbi:MAG: Holliday junction branch migration protein RuvA [bacterium]|nr:Holliday junction branch migration protein RuvA [bacterium]